MRRVDSLEKTLMLGGIGGRRRRGRQEDEMAGWYHWLDGPESGWTPGVGDGQRGLACCDSWGCKESDTTERLNWLNWTESRLYDTAAAAAKSLQSCLTLCNPINGSPPGSPSLGFSRQEHWSGLPFPSPMHESESESEITQSCPTLSDSMDCTLPGSTVHAIFQARVLEWAAIAFSNLYDTGED